MATLSQHQAQVFSRYRELISLIRRLPQERKADALSEAKQTMRARRSESDPQKALDYLREMVARIGYLRVITPRLPGRGREDAGGRGTYVLREGQLVEGEGSVKGPRVADGTISVEEAQRRNASHFKRFYGADKPNSVFF